MSAHTESTEQRVTPLELFFDLVFVFAITRVTALMAHDLSWTSIGQGLLVLAALWWGWAAYAWLTNHVAGDSGSARVVVFVAMGAMVLVALAVPGAFGDHALLFALAYLVMRLAHLGLYWVASSEEAEVHVAVARLLPTGIGGPLLLVAAAFTDGTLQAALWVLALAIDYGGPLVTGVAGYRVHPAHFAERFSLIVIIALGESIVAIGVGAGDEVLTAADRVAAVLALATSAALWWAYFDVVAPRRPPAARRAARRCAQHAGARLVRLPAPAADRRDRAVRARRRAGGRPRRRGARDRGVDGAVRRRGALPARARRVPLAQRPQPQPTAARRWRRCARRACRSAPS